jgi:hypothetical protein
MATIYHEFAPGCAVLPATGYATHDMSSGTNFPVWCLDFDAAADEAVYFVFRAVGYGSGNLTLDIDWYADTGTANNVIWGAALCVITPNTDTQDIETDAFATACTVTDSHLGTTGQRLHRATITINQLDSLAADDWVCLKVYRDADAGGDNLTGDACLVLATVSYSDN